MSSLSAAKDLGADVAVFPECAVIGFHRNMGQDVSRDSIADVLQRLGRQCADLQIGAVIGCPFYAETTQAKPWNAMVVFDETGRLLVAWPKVLFTDAEVRHSVFEPDAPDARRCFSLAGRTCAILICCELGGEAGVGNGKANYRDILPTLDVRPEVVFVPGVMDLRDTSESSGGRYAVEMAQEFRVFVVLANWPEWGGPPSDGLGGSFVVAPSGEVVCQAPLNEAAITVATIG